jgi:hypothetical protein
MNTPHIFMLILATIAAGSIGGLVGGLFFIKFMKDEVEAAKGNANVN